MFDEKEQQRNEELTTAALAGVHQEPVQEPGVAAAQPAEEQEHAAPLFTAEEAQNLRTRWDSIQAAFVDHPQEAVQEADKLVASAMKRLAEMFADERGNLEGQWEQGDKVSTEDLRLVLRRYRSFFHRLLSI